MIDMMHRIEKQKMISGIFHRDSILSNFFLCLFAAILLQQKRRPLVGERRRFFPQNLNVVIMPGRYPLLHQRDLARLRESCCPEPVEIHARCQRGPVEYRRVSPRSHCAVDEGRNLLAGDGVDVE